MMKLFKTSILLICQFLVFGMISTVTAANYIPWDELTENSWIDFFDDNDPDMYPANADAADIDDSYTISFSQAGGGNKAKGMNALKFIHHRNDEGHLVSKDLTGSFELKNSGDHNTFTTMLIVVAINSETLKNDFTMQLNMPGQGINVIDANDFSYYDNPYGRPSGYYSITDPNADALTYAFDTGMVTVYGVESMLPLGPNGSITIDYSFEELPAPAVFSVYGFIGTDPEPTIYHTNKAFLDQNDLGGEKNEISTFAVTVLGDLDSDLDVDLTDFAVFSRNWLTGVE